MVTIRYIENPFKPDEAQVKTFSYSREKTLHDLLDESGFDYVDKRIIVSGKKTDNLNKMLDRGDEVTIIPEVKAPVVAIIASAIWAAVIAHPFLFTFFVLSVGYSIYQYMNQPRMPDFNLGSGPKGGLDEGSPTYGWDGAQTIQEVGVPVAVVYGEHKIGGNIINQFMRDDGDKHYLNVLLALCEGEIDSINDIEINDNPIANFDGVDTVMRYGTNDQALISDFEDLHNLYSVGVNLTKDNPHVYTTVDSDVEGFEILLRLNNGLYQQSSGGGINSWSVTYRVEYKLHTAGSYTDLGETTISDNSRSPVRRTFRKADLTPGQYDIRVTRTSDNSSLDPLKQGDLTWYQLDELKTDDLRYPNTALLALKLLATDQLSGSVPNITAVVKGKKVLVPNVLNGATPVDWEDYYWDGTDYRLLSDDTLLTWDGTTYVEKYSANPVWCLKDFITSSGYGLGEFIKSINLDNSSFLEMSRYCEEKIAAGEGGYEKRFRLDVVIDSNTKALDLLIQLCATFNAMPVYSAGSISFKIDKQANPTQLFGMGNIVKDSFTQSWKTLKEVPNVIEVQFMDKEKGYRQETIAYIDEEAIAGGEPMRKAQIRLFTTRTSYALRIGRYALKVAKYINRTVSFKAGIDAIACQAGDVVSISHDVSQWGFSGRVQAGSTTTLVKLDRSIEIENGKSYKIQVRFQDDTIEEKNVTSSAGTYTEIECEAFSSAPQAFDVYAIGETNKVKKDFRVISIQREGTNECQVQALEYNESVYDDSNITIPDDNYSSLPFTIPLVSNITLTERVLTLADGTVENSIDVCFELPDISDSDIVNRFRGVKVYYSDNNGLSWQYAGFTESNNISIIGNIETGATYHVCVTSVSYDGQETAKADSPTDNITITGKTTPPADVSNFAFNFDDDLELTWDDNPERDIAGYEIRDEDGNWGINNANLIYRGQSNSYAYLPASRSPGTLYIKAYNTNELYSETAQSLAPTNGVPATPTVEATGFFSLAMLKWTDAADPDLQFYEVWQSETDVWGGEEELIHKTKGTSALIRVPEATGTLYFKVRAVDTYGAGSFSISHQVDFEGPEIPPGSITETEIADDAISTPKLQANSVTAAKVTTGELITLSAQIKDAIIEDAKIANLDAGKITTGTLAAERIAADSITADKLDITQLSAIVADLGTITAGTITGATLRTASAGARVVMDSSGLIAYDDAAAEIFKILTTGGDVGDVIFGNLASAYMKWDKSLGALLAGDIQSPDYVEETTGFKLTKTEGLKIWTGEVNIEALSGIITQIKEATVTNQSIGSTTFTDLLSITLTTKASNLLIIFSAGDTYGSIDGCLVEFRIQVDSVTKTGAIYGIDDIQATSLGGGMGGDTDDEGDHQHNISTDCEWDADCDTDGDHSHSFDVPDHYHEVETFNWRVPPALQKFVAVSAESHTVKVQWRRTGFGTAYIGGTYGAQLTVVEFRKSGT